MMDEAKSKKVNNIEVIIFQIVVYLILILTFFATKENKLKLVRSLRSFKIANKIDDLRFKSDVSDETSEESHM